MVFKMAVFHVVFLIFAQPIVSRGPVGVTVPNFMLICQTFAEI